MKRAGLLVIALALSTGWDAAAQTEIKPPDNRYTPAQDVQLGREAAAEAERQLPVMRDDAVTSYVERLGERLVAAIPADLRHPEFQYTFKVVNVRELNAFALPGGPMFVNRGMIESAKTEGEIAGVMAHELSHVVLRHGTAQASKAAKYEVGALAGAVLGAIIGGGVGTAVAEGTRFGIGTAFLRFSREYEKQADIEGSHIMARAGYDPRDMANMFKTLEREGGSGGPQWLSDHPNPGNRSDYITREAQLLRVENPASDTQAFAQVQTHLKELPRAPTTEQATRNAERTRRGTGDAPSGRVEPPSSRYQRYDEGNLFRVSVPANWRELQDSNSVTFAPQGAYGSNNGQDVFTHGIQFGVARNESHDLTTATDELVDSFGRRNPALSRPSAYDRVVIDGRRSLRTVLSNRSEVTGRAETIALFTTQLRDGSLFYAIAVSPRDAFPGYSDVFNRIVGSIQFRE